jgi:hypothetical protein
VPLRRICWPVGGAVRRLSGQRVGREADGEREQGLNTRFWWYKLRDD